MLSRLKKVLIQEKPEKALRNKKNIFSLVASSVFLYIVSMKTLSHIA